MLVSILVNCFNGGEFLERALNSICNQSYRNIEIIFVDNNSTDNSSHIIKNYNFDGIPVKYVKNEKTVPLYNSRNIGLKQCSGELIAFHDVDDYWSPIKLDRQVSVFLTNPEISILCSNFYICDRDLSVIKKFKKKFVNHYKGIEKLSEIYDVGLLTLLIKKEVFNCVGNFNSNFTIIGDYEFILRSSVLFNVYFLNEFLAYYSIHGNNISTLKREMHKDEINLMLSQISTGKSMIPGKYIGPLKDNLYRMIAVDAIRSSNTAKFYDSLRKINNLKIALKLKLLIYYMYSNFKKFC